MKKSEIAFKAWQAATTAAKSFANELETKGDAVTAEDGVALDALIAKAADAKAAYDRAVQLEDADAALEAATATQGRKVRNTGAPAILPEGARGSSKTLKLSNLWKATMAAGAGQNPAVIRKYASEEMDISDRLKVCGYTCEYLGSALFPLDPDLLVEPIDEHGEKLADFSALRKELRERLEVKTDPGEMAWTLKQFPTLAQALFGMDRKDMSVSDDTIGAALIPFTQSSRIIDLLRARAVLMRAGAQEVALPPSGNIAYPRWTSDPTFTYADPDTTTDMSTSNPGTGVVRLMAKSLRGAVTIPNDLLRYSSPSVEMVVRNALAAKAAIAEDNAFLEGSGSSIAPKGLINYAASAAETPTVGKITLHVASTTGTNGDTFTPEDVALIQALFEEGNDPDGATAWLMRPTFFARIRNRRADAVTAGDGKGPFMFDLTRSLKDGPVDGVGDVPVYRTTQASANRTKGSGTTLHYVLYGNFRRCIIGRVGVIELALSEHVKFLQDKTIIRAVLRNDLGLEHEESFVFTDTLLNS